MNPIEAHLSLLGQVVEDKVTGFRGMVDSVCFDAYGCIQATVKARVDAEGKPVESFWIDIKRLVPTGTRILDTPKFGAVPKGEENGPADKPSRGA